MEHEISDACVRPREIILLLGWLLICGGLMFLRSFHAAYSFDDVAHLHALAAFRAGEISLPTFLLHNHNEHFLPLVRLYFMAATRISGLSSSAMHVLLFLNYIAGAFGCAWICFSLTRSRLGAFLAGTLFAGAGGFAASMLWQTSDGEFSIAGTPLIFAIAILVSPYARKRWTDAVVLLLMFVSAMGLGSISVAALVVPIYLFVAKPATFPPGRRKVMTFLSASLVAAILVTSKWLMASHHTRTLQFALRGIYDGVLLVFFTAGRFLLAWTPFNELSLTVDVLASIAGWTLLLLTLRWVPRSLRQLLLAVWAANGLLALLIGMGRWKIATVVDLFATDRYHYIFLLPLTLQAAAVLAYATCRLLQGAAPQRKRALAVALVCLLFAALAMARIRFDKETMWYFVHQYELEFREAKVLADIVQKEAATRPLHLADGRIHFPGTLHEHLGFSTVIFTEYPKGLPGVVWSLSRTPTTSVDLPFDVAPISSADAAVENQIFDQWAKAVNRRPYSCIIDGTMQDVRLVDSCVEAAKLSNPPVEPVLTH